MIPARLARTACATATTMMTNPAPPPESEPLAALGAAERLILCGDDEVTKADGTRPGRCHVWGGCPDLNSCEPRGRCQFDLGARR